MPNLVERNYKIDRETILIEYVVEISFGIARIVCYNSANLQYLLFTDFILSNCLTAIQPQIQLSSIELSPQEQTIFEDLLKTDCRLMSASLKYCLRGVFRGSAQQLFYHRYLISSQIEESKTLN
ncbi:hypothetical protein RF11_16284 [Thelohanellus kitauei]|uniref:Uncharacterized protein n=1 Tax=Thelohanellus kitauei TaxID=669202 RepID=A0A0C2MYW4_THEKT|nr:hypothetical protein RF11_16284 [Thelohanellus kitauei]